MPHKKYDSHVTKTTQNSKDIYFYDIVALYGTYCTYIPYRSAPYVSCTKKNRKSMLLGHVNFDGQNHRFVRKGTKNGFISRFGN